MYYTFYKITNNINGKIYYGVHRTKNLSDGYMGSGTLLKRSQKKHGIQNFTKEILEIYDNCEDMFEMESVVVTEDFVKKKDNYNLAVGGLVPVKDYKDTKYYSSGKHKENAQYARELALIANQKKKEQRMNAYDKNPKLCKKCNSPLKYELKRNKFCSQSCSATMNNTGRIASDEQKKKVSKTLREKGNNVVSDEDFVAALRTVDTVKAAFKKVGIVKHADNYRRAAELILSHNIANINSNTRKNISEKTQARIMLIEQSNIDFASYGWVKEASALLGMSRNRAGKWIRNNMPDFYKNCYRRKN